MQKRNAATDRSRWEMDTRPADVIAVGSQLVYGSVGLNASVPVLTGGGMRVAAIPTTILSNLPHHESVHGFSVDPDWIGQALSDQSKLGISSEISTVYTGYFAAPEQVTAVAKWLRQTLEERPNLRVVVDPTLGDNDVGAYTDLAVGDALKEELLPLATGLTPNTFELAYLSNRSGGDPVDLARSLLGPRGQWAVLTSVNATPGGHSAWEAEDAVVTTSSYTTVPHSRIPSSAKGAGDIMTAGIVLELHRGADIVTAVELSAKRVREHLSTRFAK